jgi:N-formylglutamate amidohydrolase
VSIKHSNQRDLSNSIFHISKPIKKICPLIFSSPHSGRIYSDNFSKMTNLNLCNLRQSEDAYVDEIFASSVLYGAPLLRALFPRAYVDVNREPWELDPKMFFEPLPSYVKKKSPYISAGLGTVPKIVGSGQKIYLRKLSFLEVHKRILNHYFPYHNALKNLIKNTLSIHGTCLIIDCHSMPSENRVRRSSEKFLPDIIIGDNHGTTCSSSVVELTAKTLEVLGYSVGRNHPYAGGFITKNYSNVQKGIHVMQIEIKRSLYMNEKTVERSPKLSFLVKKFQSLIEELTAINLENLGPISKNSMLAAE